MKSLLLLVEKKLLSYRYEYFLECIALNYTNELYLLIIIGNVELALISNILCGHKRQCCNNFNFTTTN